MQRGRLANEVETVETAKACPWSSYGITRGSHGLRLLGINPSLTRAQLRGLPGPSTDCNQSNCDLYMPATGNTSYGTQVGKVSVPLVAIVGHHQLWLLNWLLM